MSLTAEHGEMCPFGLGSFTASSAPNDAFSPIMSN